MQQSSVNDLAVRFTAAYQELKEKKEIDRLLSLVKPMILSARDDGITDKELIDILNTLGFKEKFYPAKLKELRQKFLKLAQAPQGQDLDDTPSGNNLVSTALAAQGAGDKHR